MARGNPEHRSKGSWRIRVALERDPSTGKRRTKRETFVGNKRDAEKRLAAMLVEAESGTLGSAGRLTIALFIERWLLGAHAAAVPKRCTSAPRSRADGRATTSTWILSVEKRWPRRDSNPQAREGVGF